MKRGGMTMTWGKEVIGIKSLSKWRPEVRPKTLG